VPSGCYGNVVDEIVWTLIGLLAAVSFGNFYWLSAKIDGLGSRIDARIDGLGSRIDGIDARIDGLGSRIDGLSGRIDTLDARLASRLDAISVRLDAHVESHGR